MRAGTGRPVVALLIALIVGLAGAACGGDGTSSDAPTTLRVFMTDDWVTPPFLDAVRDFEAGHPNVRVEVEKFPISHMLDNVAAETRKGGAPDVVQAHAFSAAAQDLAQPVDDLWGTTIKTDEFLPGAIDDVTWAGRLYGVPLDTNALFLIFNKEQFARAGVAPPEGRISFAEFEAAAERLTTPDRSQRALAIPTSTWWTYGWIKANGGEVVSVGEDGKVQLTLDAPEVVGALDFLSRLVKAELAWAPNAADSHSSDALSLFRRGSAASLASGTWDLSILGRDPDGARYDSSLLPAGPGGGGTVMGGSSMFVPTGSTKRELAFEFMAHVVSDEYALRLAKEQGRLPVRTRVYEDPFFDSAEMVTVVDQLPTASPFKLGAFPDAHDVFAGAIDAILRDGQDAAAVMKDAQQRAQAEITSSE